MLLPKTGFFCINSSFWLNTFPVFSKLINDINPENDDKVSPLQKEKVELERISHVPKANSMTVEF